MKILRSELTGKFHDCLFFLMISVVFVFNFNTDRVLGISGNSWANICIVLFMAWWGMNIFKAGKIMWNRIYTFALLFVLLCFVSYIYSYAKDDTLDKTKTMAIVVLMSICIYQYIVMAGKMDFVLKGYSVGGMIMALYIILKTGSEVGSRFGAVVGDANLVGITLSLTATVALHLFFTQHNMLYLIQFCCMGYVILLTGSRTAALLLLLAVIVLLYAGAYTWHWKLRTVVIITIVLGAALYALWQAVMTIPALHDTLGIRIISFLQISQGQHSIINEQSTHYRMLFAKRALDWFADSPIWGNGINSFPNYNSTFTDGRHCFSHCNYTEVLSGLGILGIISYYGMYIYSLFYVWRSQSAVSIKYKPLVCALIIETLIGDIGLVVYYEKSTWILLAILAGIIHEINRIGNGETIYEQQT